MHVPSRIVHMHDRAFVFVLLIWMDCLMLIEFCFACEDIPPYPFIVILGSVFGLTALVSKVKRW